MIKGRSCLVSRHHSRAVKFSRARSGGDWGPTVVFGSKKPTTAAGIALVVPLVVSRLRMVFAVPHFLFVRRVGINSATATVVSDPVHRNVIDDGLVVDVNVCDSHVVHGAVVVEMAVSPIATIVAVAKVAEAIVHAAVETYVLSPVARVPHIHATSPPPVSRSPE